MSFRELITSNMGKIIGSAGSIIAVIGALFTIDARYAHSADVEEQYKSTQQKIQETTSVLRRQMLEDKVFEIDLRKSQDKNQKLSTIDQALRDRYQRQLDEINKKQQSN